MWTCRPPSCACPGVRLWTVSAPTSPTLRFGFELKDISDIVKDCGFGVFSGAVQGGGSVRLINGQRPRR